MRFFAFMLTGALLAGLVTTSSAQTFSNPGEYNNYIVAEQRAMLKKNLRYISKAAHSDNEKKIDARRQDLVKQTELSLNKLAKLPAYEDDKGFKDQVTEAFYQLLKVYSEDYKAVDLLAATRTATVENMEQYFRLQEVAEAKMQVINDSVDAAQHRFARRHKLTIADDAEGKRLGKYLEQVSAVNSYQHKVVLAQFRIEKSMARLSDALQAQNATTFEEARAQLLADTQVALKELAAVPAFRGKDVQYREAAKNLVNFYANMCRNHFVKLEDLMQRKDNLNKTEATTFNSIIAQLNAGSQKYTEAYNRAGANFTATYIPVMD